MRIGIIVYSQTGNTYSVMQKLEKKLTETGQAAKVERLLVETDSDDKNTRFRILPELGEYDALVFGAPVQALNLCPEMTDYLKQIGPLENKRVACLVTMGFPFAWMGGKRAIATMRKICESKGVKICGTGIVNWSRSNRDQRIRDVVDSISSIFVEQD